MAGSSPHSRRLIEPIEPEPGSFDPRAMARGEPGLPRAFGWRGRRYEVARVLRAGKETGRDRGDRYVRRHAWIVETEDGSQMEIHAERQGRRGAPRWWIRRVTEPRGNAP